MRARRLPRHGRAGRASPAAADGARRVAGRESRPAAATATTPTSSRSTPASPLIVRGCHTSPKFAAVFDTPSRVERHVPGLPPDRAGARHVVRQRLVRDLPRLERHDDDGDRGRRRLGRHGGRPRDRLRRLRARRGQRRGRSGRRSRRRQPVRGVSQPCRGARGCDHGLPRRRWLGGSGRARGLSAIAATRRAVDETRSPGAVRTPGTAATSPRSSRARAATR